MLGQSYKNNKFPNAKPLRLRFCNPVAAALKVEVDGNEKKK